MSFRAKAWTIAAISAAAFAVAMVPMTRRITAFNQNAHFARVHVEPQKDRRFKLAGFPEVQLTDAVTPDGRSALRLDFAGTPTLIPVKAPPVRDLPVLASYEEWFKPLAINQVVTDASGRSVPAPNTDRLLLVARRTPEGFKPESWGSVRRVEWLFDIYDLKPDGSVESKTYRWPRTERSERNLAKRTQGEQPKPEELELQKIPRLDERSVEFLAAMHVIPKLNVPEHKFTDTAFSPRVLGWTLPVAMFALLVFAGAVVFALSPERAPLRSK